MGLATETWVGLKWTPYLAVILPASNFSSGRIVTPQLNPNTSLAHPLQRRWWWLPSFRLVSSLTISLDANQMIFSQKNFFFPILPQDCQTPTWLQGRVESRWPGTRRSGSPIPRPWCRGRKLPYDEEKRDSSYIGCLLIKNKYQKPKAQENCQGGLVGGEESQSEEPWNASLWQKRHSQASGKWGGGDRLRDEVLGFPPLSCR